MGQWVDAADRQPEVRIELECDAEGVGLQAELQQTRVAVEGKGRRLDPNLREVRLGQSDPPKPFCLRANNAEHPTARPISSDGIDTRRLAKLRTGQDLTFFRHHGAL